jgi:hypothetical protein
MPARPIRDETMVPSNPGVLRTAVSVPQLCSGSRHEPRLTDCRLATRVRSRETTRLRRAHSFGCHKHEIRSASRWTSSISDPRLCVDCGPSWSTWHGDPWATRVDRAWASCRPSGQAGNSNQHLEYTFLREFTASSHQFSRIVVSVESRRGAVTLVSRWPLARLSPRRLSPV